MRRANAFLRQASEVMTSLELHRLSFSWRMIHLGQGLYAPGDGAGNHVHGQLQLETIISGCFRFDHESGSVAVNAGRTLFIPPHLPHGWECTRAGFMLGSLINVTGPAQGEFLELLREQRDGMFIVHSGTCMTWYRELLRLLTEPGPTAWRVPALTSVLKLLLIDLLNGMVDLRPWGLHTGAGEAAADARARDLCRYAREFLEANYAQPIQVQDVALQIGISPRHLNRLYARIQGESIGAALQRLRLERARRHLREHPEDLVKTVAYRCGFSSPAYFTACYGKAFGCAPAADRHPGTHAAAT